jgi:hypothetical protein
MLGRPLFFTGFSIIFYLYVHQTFVLILSAFRLQNDSAEETIQTIPTIGFNVEVLQYKNIKFQVRNLLYCQVLCINVVYSLNRCGILVGKRRLDHTGVVIIPIRTL